MTGPTTTGSIDAKLTVDDSDFKRGMAEAKVEAKEVGALEPTVKVDANVGPALAKLDAVALAERNLDVAYQRTAISGEKLSQVTKKYGEDSVQAASARLTMTRATNAESDAEAKLSGLRRQSTADADRDTEATNRSTQANNRRVSGLQVLLALAPSILAAAAPIAGAAVGLGAAFGVMGISGVLAIKGIKDEMADGTAVGNTYAVGLSSLKGNLDQLASTSATSMLSAFNQSVGDLDARMPALTTMVGSASAALGTMGSTALRGVLDGLQTMNPLLQAGQAELSQFVTWLFSFNGTNGFTQFINYSIDNLPSVMHLIENLVVTAGRILEAFAPLGPVMIGFLNALTDGLNSLPLPVLAGLVTAATLIGPALRLAFAPGVSALIISVGEAMGFTGVMANLAVPVVGILTAALAGVAVMSVTSAMSTNTQADATKNATRAAQDYATALQQDNDAIGENVRRVAAKALQDSGALAAARTLGIEMGTVTDAATGNSAAMAKVQGVMTAVSGAWGDSLASGQKIPQVLQDQFAAMQVLYPALGLQNQALGEAKVKQDELAAASRGQSSATGELAASYGTTVAALQSAQAAEDKAGQSTADTTIKMQLQNDAAGLLKTTLDALNGKAISAAQAQNAFDSSLANMGDHVDKVGKKVKFTTTSISDMSAASVALRGQLNGQVSNLMQVVEANGGLANSTGKARQQMVTMRQQIIDNAVAHGVDRAAVTAYIDKLMAIPKKVPPTKLDVDNAGANAKIAYTKWLLDSLHSKTIFVDVQRSESVNTGRGAAKGVGKPTAYAHGGMVNYLADGGFPDFRPQGSDTVPAMLTPGEIVMKRASVQSIGAGNLLEANRTGKLPSQGGSTSSTEQVILNLTVPDKATAKDYFDEVRFQLRQRNRGGALA